MALKNFIKDNTIGGLKDNFSGPVGALFGAAAIADIATSDNKLKSILKTIRDIVLFKPLMAAFGISVFGAMSKSVRALVHDTGSLEAALKKLRQIQGLQQVFAPLVGGADAAKKKVAELVNFAASKNLKLENVGEAARSLQIMTRGAFSGAASLDLIADAAAGTGNDIVKMSDAVGEFINTAKTGGSIAGVTEELRQMGAVSNATADQLNYLQQNGASADQLFSTLQTSLSAFKGGANSAKESLAGVNAAYATAIETLKEKFASPFTESDIQNTKNWTAALVALAPVIGRISNVLNIVFNGLGTFVSFLAKTAAQSPAATSALELLTKALVGLAMAAGAFGAVSLGTWLLEAAAAALSFGGAIGTIGAVLAGLSGLGVFVSLIGTMIGIYSQWSSAAEKAQRAVDDLRKANDETNHSLEKQIDNVKTLADRHDALAAAIDNVAKAQEALKEARAGEDMAKAAEAFRNLQAAQQAMQRASAVGSGGLAPTAQAEENARIAVSRNRRLQEQHFQNQMESSSGATRADLLTGKIGQLNNLESMGKSGLVARAQYERQRADAEYGLQQAQGALDLLPAGDSMKRRRAAAHVDYYKEQLGNVGANAPAYSSVYLDRQARLAGNTPQGAAYRLQAEQARSNESNVTEHGQRSMELAQELAMLQRQNTQAGVGTALQLGEQGARTSGNSHLLTGLQDFATFKDKFDELLPQFGEKQAGEIAGKFAANAVTIDSRQSSQALISQTAVDSLQKIGGGGNIGAIGGNDALSVAKRQADLQEKSLEYLKAIAESGGITLN